MAGDKPLSEPMMVSLPMLIYASLGLNEFHKFLPIISLSNNFLY